MKIVINFIWGTIHEVKKELFMQTENIGRPRGTELVQNERLHFLHYMFTSEYDYC